MAKPYELHPSPIIVDPEDQTLILTVLLVFPSELWLEKHWTSDREKYWFDLAIVSRHLHYVFSCNFESQIITVNKVLPKKTLKLYEVERDYYLSLYQLAKCGWDAIAADQAKSDWGMFSVFSPGDLVSSAIAIDCLAAFSACLTYSEFRTTAAYNLYRQKKSVEEMIRSGQELTGADQAKVKSCLEGIRTIRKPMEPFFCFLDHVVHVCNAAAENNPNLRHYLSTFLSQAELQQEAQMRRMPETPSYAWNKGDKLQAQRYGGTYQSS